MKTSDLLPGLVVAVRISRFSVRRAAVERILEPLGIDAQRYSSEGGFRLSLDVMEHLCTLLQK